MAFDKVQWQREYRAKNKERLAERDKKYREENKERKAEWSRKYREKNRERMDEYARQYRAENREKIREYKRKYNKGHRELASKWAKETRERHPEAVAAQRQKHYWNNLEKGRAREAVRKAIRNNALPPVWTMVCEHCQEAQAAHYHHDIDYEPENHLQVAAVCTECHGKSHWKE